MADAGKDIGLALTLISQLVGTKRHPQNHKNNRTDLYLILYLYISELIVL